MTRATIAAAGLRRVVATSAVLAIGRSGAATTADPGEAVRAELRAEIEALDTSLVALAGQPTSLAAFQVARDRYRRLEGPLEFYAPALAATFNSRRQEVDDDDAPPRSALSPQGFPALEPLLFSSERVDADSARRITGHMRGLVERVARDTPPLVNAALQPAQFADGARRAWKTRSSKSCAARARWAAPRRRSPSARHSPPTCDR